MLCGYPKRLVGPGKDLMVRCGKCIPCRINHRREWTGKMLLEQRTTEVPSSFVTLTYAPESSPVDDNLYPPDLTRFIDSVRHDRGLTAFVPGSLRYFAVGEYGDKSWHPHYHAILFGVPPSEASRVCDRHWPHGYNYVGDVNSRTIAYVAGYCVKKMTQTGDERLGDRHPEFVRMSRFPPLGTDAIRDMIQTLNTKSGSLLVAQKGDVPNNYTLEGKTWPISKYHRAMMREQLGVDNPSQEQWTVEIEDQDNATKKAQKAWRRRRQNNRSI